MKKQNEYEVIKLKKSNKNIARIRLLEPSGYPGIIVEFISFVPKNKESTDFLLTYKILKSSKNYRDLTEDHKDKFDFLIKKIFKELIGSIIKKDTIIKK